MIERSNPKPSKVDLTNLFRLHALNFKYTEHNSIPVMWAPVSQKYDVDVAAYIVRIFEHKFDILKLLYYCDLPASIFHAVYEVYVNSRTSSIGL